MRSKGLETQSSGCVVDCIFPRGCGAHEVPCHDNVFNHSAVVVALDQMSSMVKHCFLRIAKKIIDLLCLAKKETHFEDIDVGAGSVECG